MEGRCNLAVRIVQACPFYPPHVGGVQNYVANLSAALADRHDVTVLTYDTEGVGNEEGAFTVERIPPVVRYFNASWAPRYRRRLRELAQEADVVHVHAPFPFGLEWACDADAKVVATYHGEGRSFKRPWYSLPRAAYSRWEKRALGGPDAVVFLSTNYRDSLPLPRRVLDRSHIIPTGVDTARFHPLSRETRLWGDKGKHVVYVGALVEANRYKGVDVLVRAARILDATIHVVGRGGLVPEYRSLAKRLRARNVEFHEDYDNDDLAHAYRSADCFVLPSVSGPENGPLVVVEAMASGTPVVVTDIPGVVEMVDHGRLGMIAKPNDPADLARCIEAAMVGGKERAALEHVVANRGWPAVATRYEALYHELAK